jgi:hypothetical protein
MLQMASLSMNSSFSRRSLSCLYPPQHASHVTMSVNKLLQRVVAPELTFKRRSLQMDGNSLKKQIASDLHNYTYGITSDPLTQFAVVFAALIHDCDHWGESDRVP